MHDDRVRRDFTATGPNRLWLADITEHDTREGKLYLCAVKDVFSKRIVGYSIDERMRSRLAVTALNNAVARRGHVDGCILHSDRGSQGGFNRSSQHPSSGDAMEFKVRDRSVNRGIRALTEERRVYLQLVDQGVGYAEAARIVGINVRTGKRWRNGRTASGGTVAALPIDPSGASPKPSVTPQDGPSRYQPGPGDAGLRQRCRHHPGLPGCTRRYPGDGRFRAGSHYGAGFARGPFAPAPEGRAASPSGGQRAQLAQHGPLFGLSLSRLVIGVRDAHAPLHDHGLRGVGVGGGGLLTPWLVSSTVSLVALPPRATARRGMGVCRGLVFCHDHGPCGCADRVHQAPARQGRMAGWGGVRRGL
ncbi:DDE-type integrase/transposase/recombinase [Streptomyces noboritoensis]|uniref:DDE-type integrase/transposase/recombinase n=1 Tax=Streptomyces noboritoensis TaxID=67337 RepID=A0ABV6TGR5_9ACTN